MHPAAQAWDDTLIAVQRYYPNGQPHRVDTVRRGNLKQPTYDRPCDWCGLPLLQDGIYVHAHCLRAERIIALEQVRQYRLLQPLTK